MQEYTDKHYNFTLKLTTEEIQKGEIRLDPYLVSKVWQLGKKDDTGCLFHILKTIARFGEKNSTTRELTAIEKTLKRFKELVKPKETELKEPQETHSSYLYN